MQLQGFTDVSAILRQGVYALTLNGVVVYIGQAKCPLIRCATHRNQRGKKRVPWITAEGVLFDSVHVLPCHPDLIDEAERQLIAHYRPRYNIQHNPSGPLGGPIEVHPGIILGAARRPDPQPQIYRRPLHG